MDDVKSKIILHCDYSDPHAVNYLVENSGGDPRYGRVRLDINSLLWNATMLIISITGGISYFSWTAFVLFICTTGVALLLGHSVGYHRKLIHNSFECPQWLERVLVWFGAWVGMAGPFGIMRTHDLRDWAQRQSDCHPYFSHQNKPLRDAWWQIYCRIDLEDAPQFDLKSAGEDSFYQWLERRWRWQQLPIAMIFYAIGGLEWVIWGVAVRIAIANHGHWLVGYLAHRHGPQSWIVQDAGVQAYNVPWAAIPTMGEAWHNNHHAYPASAKIGLYPGQSDWGYRFIILLQHFRLAWNVNTPDTLPHRNNLRAVSCNNEPKSIEAMKASDV